MPTTKREVYETVEDGDWFHLPLTKKLKIACCDCGLVHSHETKIVVGARGARRVMTSLTRNDRATAAVRRGKRHRKEQ